MPLLSISLTHLVSNSEDHHLGRRGCSHSGGRRSLDPTSGRHQDPAQEQGSDAHQRPSKGKLERTAEFRLEWRIQVEKMKSIRNAFVSGKVKLICSVLIVLVLSFSLQAFENTLKSWEDKLKYDKPPLRPHLYPQHSVDLATEEEASLVQMCARAAEELITR